MNKTLQLPLDFSIMTQRSCFQKMIASQKQATRWLGEAWNDLLLCVVSALRLKCYIGRISFYHTTHMIFPGGSVSPGSGRPDDWSIDSECKTKNW